MAHNTATLSLEDYLARHSDQLSSKGGRVSDFTRRLKIAGISESVLKNKSRIGKYSSSTYSENDNSYFETLGRSGLSPHRDPGQPLFESSGKPSTRPLVPERTSAVSMLNNLSSMGRSYADDFDRYASTSAQQREAPIGKPIGFTPSSFGGRSGSALHVGSTRSPLPENSFSAGVPASSMLGGSSTRRNFHDSGNRDPSESRFGSSGIRGTSPVLSGAKRSDFGMGRGASEKGSPSYFPGLGHATLGANFPSSSSGASSALPTSYHLSSSSSPWQDNDNERVSTGKKGLNESLPGGSYLTTSALGGCSTAPQNLEPQRSSAGLATSSFNRGASLGRSDNGLSSDLPAYGSFGSSSLTGGLGDASYSRSKVSEETRYSGLPTTAELGLGMNSNCGPASSAKAMQVLPSPVLMFASSKWPGGGLGSSPYEMSLTTSSLQLNLPSTQPLAPPPPYLNGAQIPPPYALNLAAQAPPVTPYTSQPHSLSPPPHSPHPPPYALPARLAYSAAQVQPPSYQIPYQLPYNGPAQQQHPGLSYPLAGISTQTFPPQSLLVGAAASGVDPGMVVSSLGPHQPGQSSHYPVPLAYYGLPSYPPPSGYSTPPPAAAPHALYGGVETPAFAVPRGTGRETPNPPFAPGAASAANPTHPASSSSCYFWPMAGVPPLGISVPNYDGSLGAPVWVPAPQGLSVVLDPGGSATPSYSAQPSVHTVATAQVGSWPPLAAHLHAAIPSSSADGGKFFVSSHSASTANRSEARKESVDSGSTDAYVADGSFSGVHRRAVSSSGVGTREQPSPSSSFFTSQVEPPPRQGLCLSRLSLSASISRDPDPIKSVSPSRGQIGSQEALDPPLQRDALTSTRASISFETGGSRYPSSLMKPYYRPATPDSSGSPAILAVTTSPISSSAGGVSPYPSRPVSPFGFKKASPPPSGAQPEGRAAAAPAPGHEVPAMEASFGAVVDGSPWLSRGNFPPPPSSAAYHSWLGAPAQTTPTGVSLAAGVHPSGDIPGFDAAPPAMFHPSSLGRIPPPSSSPSVHPSQGMPASGPVIPQTIPTTQNAFFVGDHNGPGGVACAYGNDVILPPATVVTSAAGSAGCAALFPPSSAHVPNPSSAAPARTTNNALAGGDVSVAAVVPCAGRATTSSSPAPSPPKSCLPASARSSLVSDWKQLRARYQSMLTVENPFDVHILTPSAPSPIGGAVLRRSPSPSPSRGFVNSSRTDGSPATLIDFQENTFSGGTEREPFLTEPSLNHGNKGGLRRAVVGHHPADQFSESRKEERNHYGQERPAKREKKSPPSRAVDDHDGDDNTGDDEEGKTHSSPPNLGSSSGSSKKPGTVSSSLSISLPAEDSFQRLKSAHEDKLETARSGMAKQSRLLEDWARPEVVEADMAWQERARERAAQREEIRRIEAELDELGRRDKAGSPGRPGPEVSDNSQFQFQSTTEDIENSRAEGAGARSAGDQKQIIEEGCEGNHRDQHGLTIRTGDKKQEAKPLGKPSASSSAASALSWSSWKLPAYKDRQALSSIDEGTVMEEKERYLCRIALPPSEIQDPPALLATADGTIEEGAPEPAWAVSATETAPKTYRGVKEEIGEEGRDDGGMSPSVLRGTRAITSHKPLGTEPPPIWPPHGARAVEETAGIFASLAGEEAKELHVGREERQEEREREEEEKTKITTATGRNYTFDVLQARKDYAKWGLNAEALNQGSLGGSSDDSSIEPGEFYVSGSSDSDDSSVISSSRRRNSPVAMSKRRGSRAPRKDSNSRSGYDCRSSLSRLGGAAAESLMGRDLSYDTNAGRPAYTTLDLELTALKLDRAEEENQGLSSNHIQNPRIRHLDPGSKYDELLNSSPVSAAQRGSVISGLASLFVSKEEERGLDDTDSGVGASRAPVGGMDLRSGSDSLRGYHRRLQPISFGEGGAQKAVGFHPLKLRVLPEEVCLASPSPASSTFSEGAVRTRADACSPPPLLCPKLREISLSPCAKDSPSPERATSDDEEQEQTDTESRSTTEKSESAASDRREAVQVMIDLGDDELRPFALPLASPSLPRPWSTAPSLPRISPVSQDEATEQASSPRRRPSGAKCSAKEDSGIRTSRDPSRTSHVPSDASYSKWVSGAARDFLSLSPVSEGHAVASSLSGQSSSLNSQILEFRIASSSSQIPLPALPTSIDDGGSCASPVDSRVRTIASDGPPCDSPSALSSYSSGASPPTSMEAGHGGWPGSRRSNSGMSRSEQVLATIASLKSCRNWKGGGDTYSRSGSDADVSEANATQRSLAGVPRPLIQ